MQILRTTAPVVTVDSVGVDDAVAFYERVLGEPVRARFRNPTGTLDLILIGSMLLISGTAQALAARQELKGTFVVDSVDEWRSEMQQSGATIVEEPAAGPMSATGAVGRFMFVRHPDGSLFEYFQPNP